MKRPFSFVAAAALALPLLVALGATARADGDFRSPTGNIGCAAYDDVLRCDVRDGLHPMPADTEHCQLDFGQGYILHSHGTVRPVCAGDTTLGATATLPYGKPWRFKGMRCDLETSGITCKNLDGHGFFMARGETRAF